MNRARVQQREISMANPLGGIVVKLGNFILGLLCAFSLTTGAAGQSTSPTKPHAADKVKQGVAASQFLYDPTQKTEQPAKPGESDSPYFKGKARFLTLRRDMRQLKGSVRGGSAASTSATFNPQKAARENEENEHMPFWQGSFDFLGATFPFRMIGTNPANGSATTRIPVTIIPLQINFPDGSQISGFPNSGVAAISKFVFHPGRYLRREYAIYRRVSTGELLGRCKHEITGLPRAAFPQCGTAGNAPRRPIPQLFYSKPLRRSHWI